MIDLTGCQPAWPGEAVELWRACAADAAGRTELWRTPAPRGEELLREQLGILVDRDPEHLTITAGVRATALTYARRAAQIMLERPGFPGVGHALGQARARVRRADWDRLLHGNLPPGCVLWLTSPCRNPDGATLTGADLVRLGERAEAGHRVVVNAAYAPFAPAQRPPESVDVLGTLHKLAGHGARLGWVCSRRYFDEAVPELLGTTPPRVWQLTWGLFLAAGALPLLAAVSADATHAAWTAFRHRLARSTRWHGLPDHAPHILLDVVPGWTEATALDRLRDLGFALNPGTPFDAPRPALRASFLGVAAADAARFAEAVAGCDVLAPAAAPARAGAGP